MTDVLRPAPPDAERIRLVAEIRSYGRQIEDARKALDALYDERAKRILSLWDGGYRYIDLERVTDLNGGTIQAALKRARRLRTKQATDRADDLVNERTIDHAP